ncbi:hypothetical protein BV25DRAFT_1922614 [Artomyces pyxidatus]|uniref:Uncharacterized protein n=1 Tax=Artomyces pyxidatus TaxID=48021 RepID=A0ACB8SDB0_9AGAM|nr:hypothetical protein BV25DRAFT_1922614 [Artomyces pyxidatus]
MLLSQFSVILGEQPILQQSLSFPDLLLFLRLVDHLRETLAWYQAPNALGPPRSLPPHVSSFCAAALGIDTATHPFLITQCWEAFRDVVWAPSFRRSSRYDPLHDGGLLDVFLIHGLQHELGFFDLYPSTRICLDPHCARASYAFGGRELSRLLRTPATIFTRDFGALPIWSYSASCSGCNSRYYPNYYVLGTSKRRTYYQGVPSVVHVAMHSFIERGLCDRFTQSMVCAWVSASNNARIYELEHGTVDTRFPAHWPTSHILTVELVWDCFFLYGLLRDCEENATVLVLDNAADQADRLRPALEARTMAMAGPGQELWNHACDLCCAMEEREGCFRAIRAVVTDGVTIGRPCCGVHDCQEPLPTQRAHFCATHRSLSAICVVTTCDALAQPGHQTCLLPDHRALEKQGIEARSAMFQLRKRLEHIKAVYPEDDTTRDGGVMDGEVMEVDAGGDCTGKPDAGNARPRARFGRRRTHNEQLCVATCGVVLGRATFYGSEAPNGVRLFLRALFPTTSSLPDVIFYDNNCQLKRHILRSDPNNHFNRCALPVDVFHMKSKHKESDDFCGQNCNPAMFPDLMVAGRWRFNSSAAEMTNAWFGGFQSIVREMRKDRYDFFLDEMIKQRNRITTNELRLRQKCPYQIPRRALGL